MIAEVPEVLVSHPDAPFKTFPELRAYAKANRARAWAMARARQGRRHQIAMNSAVPKLTTRLDPDPKTPRLKAPNGACDSHIHLFGPASKYPFAADSPYHAHEASPETLVALQDTLGLSTAVIVSGGAYRPDARLGARRDILVQNPRKLYGF